MTLLEDTSATFDEITRGLAPFYEAPVATTPSVVLEENELAWFVIPIGMLAWFGGMWAWCKTMCRNNGGVKSCSSSYAVNVKVVCKR